ncbi:MAG: hypothetical protein ACLSDJ_02960 [Butyricimonas faecihominis]
MACRNVERAAGVRMRLCERRKRSGGVTSVGFGVGCFHPFFFDGLNGREVSVLVNNAGIMCRDFTTTEDGLETTVGVNYVGTWLLTKWLLPNMGRTGRPGLLTRRRLLVRWERLEIVSLNWIRSITVALRLIPIRNWRY